MHKRLHVRMSLRLKSKNSGREKRPQEAVELCRVLVETRSTMYAPDAPELKDAKSWLNYLTKKAG